MQHLTRTRVGKFDVDDSLTLNQIAALMLKGELEDKLVSVDSLFDHERVVFGEEFNKLLYNGNQLPYEQVLENEQYLVYDGNDEFIGVYVGVEGGLKPVKMFYTGNNDEV